MTTNNRFPASYTLLAGLTGLIAWGLPYPAMPFVRIIAGSIIKLPVYKSPPFTIYLWEFVISYFLAGVLAGGLFLLGLRIIPVNRERFSRPKLNSALVLSTLAGMATGGALAILFGSGIGYSQTGYSLAIRLGFFNSLPDPYLSIGWMIGAALATLIICAYSGIGQQMTSLTRSAVRVTLGMAFKVSLQVLIVRFIVYLIEYSSIVKFTLGNSPATFMLFEAAGGVLFGILAWTVTSRLKAA